MTDEGNIKQPSLDGNNGDSYPVDPQRVINNLQTQLARVQLECAVMGAGFEQQREENAFLREKLDEFAAALAANSMGESVDKPAHNGKAKDEKKEKTSAQ